MNFELTQDQQMLAEAVRQFVKKESPVSRFRGLREDAQGCTGPSPGKVQSTILPYQSACWPVNPHSVGATI